jgi:mycofactocin system FadH/OYE family oxidoreductase 1
MRLLDPVDLGPRTAPNRVLFGPLVTNLGRDDAPRALSARHVAFYRRRAEGGCGTIVVEEAAVHHSDWPYERSPLAERCGEGWSAIAGAVRDAGPSLVIAALGHSGGQGSSAYSQRELWAPSRVPEVNSREVPKWMEADDVAAVVDGFRTAAATATAAGLDGVEVNAGQHSLVRQFLSGLTNHRDDEWGTDRRRFATDVIAAVRAGLGPDRVLGLRLSCDELAPWAGITPEQSLELAAALVAQGVDYLVVVRGSIYSVEQTRPDHHQPAGCNVTLCRSVRSAVRDAVGDRVAVVLQGSVVDPDQAEWAIGDGVADAVEMTRAQLADADLVSKLRAGTPERIRPCLRCNQACQARDARNPVVSCVVDPSAGHETTDPAWEDPSVAPRDVLVVGAGPAGLEAARVAATRGHRVRIVEATDRLGGAAAVAGPARPFVGWLVAECERLGVTIETNATATPSELAALPATTAVVLATGSRPGTPAVELEDGATLFDVLAVRAGTAALPAEGPVVLLDPIGGPIAVAIAEELGERAVLVTPDHIAGNELSRTGDLAPANVRLQQRGVRVERRTIPRAVRARPGFPPPGETVEIELEDRFSGARRTLLAAAVVDCGYRLPDDGLWEAMTAVSGPPMVRAGDVVAPRTVLDAVLDARRAAVSIDALRRRPD